MLSDHIIKNFYLHKACRSSPGKVIANKQSRVTVLSLYGGDIAYLCQETDKLAITNNGLFSVSLAKMLSRLKGVKITGDYDTWYLNDRPWDGGLIEVSEYGVFFETNISTIYNRKNKT